MRDSLELELFCPQCSTADLCNVDSMLARLRSVGFLRREAKPDPAFVVELFRTSAKTFSCHHCGALELLVRSAPIESWPETRTCESCGARIPTERLEIFPKATRCAACETQSRQHNPDELEYCPRCGDVMKVRLAGGSGIARYVTSCPTCRK